MQMAALQLLLQWDQICQFPHWTLADTRSTTCQAFPIPSSTGCIEFCVKSVEEADGFGGETGLLSVLQKVDKSAKRNFNAL